MAGSQRILLAISSVIFTILLYKLLSHPSFLSVPAVYQKDYKMSPEEQAAWYGYLATDPSLNPPHDDNDVVVPDADAARNIAFEALADQGGA